MTDLSTLTDRVLEEVTVIGEGDIASDADTKKVLKGLKSAHYELETEGLLRWTMSDIPSALEEPYVLMGAFNIGKSYGMPQDPMGYGRAMKQIRAYVMTIKADAPVPSESF